LTRLGNALPQLFLGVLPFAFAWRAIMSGQGYHLALDRDHVAEVLSCNDEMALLDWVDQALGEFDRDAGFIHGGYKDWNILLGCLTNGDYDPKGGTYPLNRCFFGGRLLVTEGSIVNLVMPNEVVDVAEALDLMDEPEIRRRCGVALPRLSEELGATAGQYQGELYEKLVGLRDFYRHAAQEGRAMLFYTDDPLDYFFKTG
jgi:Domain of unknown function (DUF1877)